MFVDAWNHRDPDALAALFDTDAEFVNVTGLWWHTRDEIRKRSRVRADPDLQRLVAAGERRQSEAAIGRDCGCPRAHDAHWPDVSGRDHGAATTLECDVICRPSDAGRLALRVGPQYRRRTGK
jgi:hypothetical protein